MPAASVTLPRVPFLIKPSGTTYSTTPARAQHPLSEFWVVPVSGRTLRSPLLSKVWYCPIKVRTMWVSHNNSFDWSWLLRVWELLFHLAPSKKALPRLQWKSTFSSTDHTHLSRHLWQISDRSFQPLIIWVVWEDQSQFFISSSSQEIDSSFLLIRLSPTDTSFTWHFQIDFHYRFDADSQWVGWVVDVAVSMSVSMKRPFWQLPLSLQPTPTFNSNREYQCIKCIQLSHHVRHHIWASYEDWRVDISLCH